MGAPLRNGYRDGQEAYGDLDLAFEVFSERARALAHRQVERAELAPTDARVDEALERLVLPDLYLAHACELGTDAAWRALHDHFLDALTHRARRFATGFRDN